MELGEAVGRFQDWLKANPEVAEALIPRDHYWLTSTQQALDVGLNGFGATLLAESFAVRRKDWEGKTLSILCYGKDRLPVWVTLREAPPFGLESREPGFPHPAGSEQERDDG